MGFQKKYFFATLHLSFFSWKNTRNLFSLSSKIATLHHKATPRWERIEHLTTKNFSCGAPLEGFVKFHAFSWKFMKFRCKISRRLKDVKFPNPVTYGYPSIIDSLYEFPLLVCWGLAFNVHGVLTKQYFFEGAEQNACFFINTRLFLGRCFQGPWD